MRVVHLDGKLVPEDAARISPFDRGFLLGDGVFETMRAYAGRPFALAEHLARLGRSCALARLPAPEGLPEIIGEVLRANALTDASVRVTVSRGPGGRGASPRGAGPPTVLVTAAPLEPRDPERGLRAVTARRPHVPMEGAKATSYFGNVLARMEADEAGADEALFVDAEGFLVEATQANVFAVLGTDLVTPPLSSGCLAGVTRAHILALAVAPALRPVERPLARAELLAADEAFLCASVLEVGALVELDGARIGSGTRGPATRALHDAYRALATRATRHGQNENV